MDSEKNDREDIELYKRPSELWEKAGMYADSQWPLIH